MIPGTGLSANTVVVRIIFLFFTVALLGACDDDNGPVKQQVQGKASEPSLPVKEWYPRPKHMSQPQTYFRQPVTQPQQMMSSQSPNQGAVSQGTWAMPATQPVYTQPPPVIVYQGQQYVPRPWGDPAGADVKKQTNVYSETWPPNNYYSPGGVPATGGGYTGWDTGQYGAVPSTGYYGNVWQYP
jgi:hypothetical protein